MSSSSSPEVAEFGATVSSACTSSGSLGHGHASIEALSRLREDAFFAKADAEACAKLREEMRATAAHNCEQSDVSKND